MNIKLRDFTEYPGLRHASISDKSGEEFYHKTLNKSFKECFERKEKLTVNLDDTAGFAPSFLDEAFGNLVFDFGKKQVENTIEIISIEEPDLKKMLEETYEQWEQRRIKGDKPKKTMEKISSWFRLSDKGEIEEVFK